MNRTRPLTAVLSLTLVAALGACGPKQQPPEAQTPTEPVASEPRPAAPARASERVAPTEPERPSEAELQRMAVEFNRQGALQMIFFETDDSELLPEAKQILAANAAWLRAHPEFAVLVAGHCDERNTEEYNLALGERRAEAVHRYLLSLGVSDARIETISLGEMRPLDTGRSAAAWSRNRRAEFEVRPLRSSRDS